MVKKIGVKIFALAVVLLLTVPDLAAQNRIRFRRGTNSATVSGSLDAGGATHYVLGAKRGQRLTAALSSGNGKVDFIQGNVHDTQYSITLEQSGDVEISIDNHGGPTRYTLTVSIQ